MTVELADPATEPAAASGIDDLPDFDHRNMVTDALPEGPTFAEAAEAVIAMHEPT
ncbi:MAG: hypothetical protein OXH52_16505 [Gammaproteobacteria bacterium]|nr:hypothetical protein [Gammaproteobacteria bacterium]